MSEPKTFIYSQTSMNASQHPLALQARNVEISMEITPASVHSVSGQLQPMVIVKVCIVVTK